MENNTVTIVHDTNSANKEIRNVTIILTILTLVELAFGFAMIGMSDGMLKHFIKGIIVILMLAKAFYIVAYFMHLKHEVKSMIVTVILPLVLFVWFIIAFLADGSSFNNLKNRYNPYYEEQSKQKQENRH